MVVHNTGAVIDATLVASAARPKSMTIIGHDTDENFKDVNADSSSQHTQAPCATNAQSADDALRMTSICVSVIQFARVFHVSRCFPASRRLPIAVN